MSQPSAQMRSLAEKIIAHEVGQSRSAGTSSTASFPVLEKLRTSLTALVGVTGFSALLSRALVLASSQDSWPRHLRVNADGSLKELADLGTQLAPAQIAAGRTALLAQFLELLRAFIGEAMTTQLMRESWPHLVFPKSHSGNGDKHAREE